MSVPPDDENPESIHGLVNELSKELEAAGFVDEDVQEELMQGIQDSLRAMFGEVFEVEPPNVTVVEGGRRMDEPVTTGAPPELKVASFESEQVEVEDGSTLDFDSSNVSVRVFRPKGGGVPSLSSGNIHLEAIDEEQCMYSGDTLKMYRILLFRGEAEVFSGGTCICTLKEKQSMDVEGRKITIRARAGEVSGMYSHILAPS